MAVSDYDKQYLSQDNQNKIADLTSKAESGSISWADAHAGAEAIRNSAGGYSGGSQGNEYHDLTGGFGNTSLVKESGGSRTTVKKGYAPGDYSKYLKDMYAANTESQLAQLKAAYDKNAGTLQSAAEKIPVTYQNARNDAAATNEIERNNMNEYFTARGLNTGTSGQAALANSGTLQRNLGNISTQEANAIAENQRQQDDLATQYQNAIVQAQAEGNAALAQALYNEYVRQDNAKQNQYQYDTSLGWQQQQFAAGQDQWQKEFDAAQQQFDANMGLKNQAQAYDLATTMLGMGVMPDAATLSAAGISAVDAQSIANTVKAQQALKQAAKVKTPSAKTNNPVGTTNDTTNDTVYDAALKRVLVSGGTAQQRTATIQMLQKYGQINDATAEKLFTEITSGKYDKSPYV